MQKLQKWARVNYQPNLPLGKNGEKVTASKVHIQLSKEAAKEGMVLLKNENQILPFLNGTKVALFGKAVFDYVKGGGGSGDVTVSYTRNLYDGLKEKKDKIEIFEELADYYRENVKAQYQQGKIPGMTVEPEVPQQLLQKAKAYTNTAIIAISRFSGEGWDRGSDDFYLTKEEEAMVACVKENFAKVAVVLNVGGMVDTSWFYSEKKIGAVLMAWQGGIEGGLAAADLLIGEASPCGKLTDTFAKRLEDYPSTFGFQESPDYVNYTEDIYVGYRYFETIPYAVEKVNYPFGYGLSYTKFEIEVQKAGNIEQQTEGQEEQIFVQAVVTNIGNYAGKEVVQVYMTAPQGKLGKPAKELVAFQKTRLLQPGEQQTVVLSWKTADMASYDDYGIIQQSAYILEKGNYSFYIGNSVREAVAIDYIYQTEQDKVVKQLTKKLTPVSLEKRMLADGSYEALPIIPAFLKEAEKKKEEDKNILEKMNLEEEDGYAPITVERPSYRLWGETPRQKHHFLEEAAEGKITIEQFIDQLSDQELAMLLGGQPNTGVANTFGYGNLPDYGVPNIMTADGPAGLRIAPECGVYTTAFPCATLLACTWNPELIEQVGAAGAEEVKENNIAVWLTPAINIHRNPLCGRNFEYYSEDPFLTGKLAAAMVRGIQSKHISAAVKHFALNNKEGNRKNSDSMVSERAAREIYLKPFEIIVKEANPWVIMSSYNKVNGQRTSENRELLEDILRGEWGFQGMVTTDWWNYGEHYKEVKAGNNVKMPIGYPERLLKAIEKGVLTRKDMEASAKKVLELILKID